MLVAMLFIGMGSMAFAQQGPGKRKVVTAEERAKRSTEVLAKKLSLTDEQQKEVYAINLANIQKMQADCKEQAKEVKATLRNRDEKISNVLNGSQKEAYQSWKKDAGKKRMQFRKGHRNPEKISNSQEIEKNS